MLPRCQLPHCQLQNWLLINIIVCNESIPPLCDIIAGHVRTLLADRNITGHAAAVLSAWIEEYKAVGSLERSLAAQDTIMQIYRSSLTNDSHSFFEVSAAPHQNGGNSIAAARVLYCWLLIVSVSTCSCSYPSLLLKYSTYHTDHFLLLLLLLLCTVATSKRQQNQRKSLGLTRR